MVIFGLLGTPDISSESTNSNPLHLSAFSTFSIVHSKSSETCPFETVTSFLRVQVAFWDKNILSPLSKVTFIFIGFPFVIDSIINAVKMNLIFFPSGLKWLICLKDILLFFLLSFFFNFPLAQDTSLLDAILLRLNISLFPLLTVVSGIIILVFSKVPSNSHSIETLLFLVDFGNLHMAVSPVTKVILNTKSFTISSKGWPSIINIPVSIEPVALILVALKLGKSGSVSLASSTSFEEIKSSVFEGFFNFGSSGIFVKFWESSISRLNISVSLPKLLTSHSRVTGSFGFDGVILFPILQTASVLFESNGLIKLTSTVIVSSFVTGAFVNAAITNVTFLLFLSNLNFFACLKDNLLLNFLSNFTFFPLATVTSLGVEILFILIFSIYPSNNGPCGIINIVLFNSSCNSHSILTVFLVLSLGSLHLAFCPEANTISNTKSSSNSTSERNFPFIVKIPLLLALDVSIDVAFNIGIASSFVFSLSKV